MHTGYTIVTREPEWDDYTRAEAMADLEVDVTRCKQCGQEGTFVPMPQATRMWTWGDGRQFEVLQFRCLTCAAIDTIRRDVQSEEGKREPQTGHYTNSDGLRVVARPYEQRR